MFVLFNVFQLTGRVELTPGVINKYLYKHVILKFHFPLLPIVNRKDSSNLRTPILRKSLHHFQWMLGCYNNSLSLTGTTFCFPEIQKSKFLRSKSSTSWPHMRTNASLPRQKWATSWALLARRLRDEKSWREWDRKTRLNQM